MPGLKLGRGPMNPVYLPPWEYLGGQTIAGNAGSQNAILPAGTTIVEIDAEGGDIQCQINLGFCPAVGAGFVPENGARIYGPLINLNSFHVNMAVGVTAHLMYFREYADTR